MKQKRFFALILAFTLLFTTTASATETGGASEGIATYSLTGGSFFIDYQAQGLASLGDYFVSDKPQYACFVVNSSTSETTPSELYQWSSASGGNGSVSTYNGSTGRKYIKYSIGTTVANFCSAGLLIDVSSLMGSATSFDLYFPEYSDSGGIYFDGVADWTSSAYTYFTTRSISNNSWYGYNRFLENGDTFNTYSTLLDGVKPMSCDVNDVSTVTIDGHRFTKYSLTLKADQNPRKVVQFVIAGCALCLSQSYDAAYFSYDMLNNIYIDLDNSVVPDSQGPAEDGTGSGSNTGGGGDSGSDEDTTGQLTDIKDAVTELPNSIAGKIADAIKGLFIPSDSQMLELRDSLDAQLSEKLGVVWTAFDSLLSILRAGLSPNSDGQIFFPGLSLTLLGSTFSLAPQSVSIWPSGFDTIEAFVRGGVTMVIILAWLRGLVSIKDRIIGDGAET